MNKLRTERCLLEPQVEAHAHAMFKVLSDPAIYEFENMPPSSEEWLQSRFRKLEARRSPDGKQHWLNWVVRLHTEELAGYVQATVLDSEMSYVAYEFSSTHWRKGLASASVSAMLVELASRYHVDLAVAVLKSQNFRSHGLLQHLDFDMAGSEVTAVVNPEPDEIVMAKSIVPLRHEA